MGWNINDPSLGNDPAYLMPRIVALERDKLNISEKGVTVATLIDGKVPLAQLPPIDSGGVKSVNSKLPDVNGDVSIPVFSGSYPDLTNKPTPITLNNTVTSTSATEAATANAVKTAYDRAQAAFQSANDGKVAVANAVTAKGVAASPSDTFAVLASKIGQISPGKKQASGTSNAVNQRLVVSGLGFLPNNIIAYRNSGATIFSLHIGSLNKGLIFSTSGATSEVSNTIVLGGFDIKTWTLADAYTWFAYE